MMTRTCPMAKAAKCWGIRTGFQLNHPPPFFYLGGLALLTKSPSNLMMTRERRPSIDKSRDHLVGRAANYWWSNYPLLVKIDNC